MQKIKIGLAVVAMAITLSSYTNYRSGNLIRNHVYTLNAAGTLYEKASSTGVLPPGDCQEQQTLPPCYISYDNDQGTDFSASAIPSGGEPSDTNGFWE